MIVRPAIRSRALLLAAASLAAAPAYAADDAPRAAWGKAGVGYEQYRDDAYVCAEVGLNADIAQTEPVEQLRSATRRMEAADSQFSSAASTDPMEAGVRHAQEAAAIRAATRPEKRVQEVKEIIFAATQRCMAEQGYVLFALTEEQRGEMAEMKKRERRAYLHRLASDAAILERQKVASSAG
jgi:hypothetical protein